MLSSAVSLVLLVLFSPCGAPLPVDSRGLVYGAYLEQTRTTTTNQVFSGCASLSSTVAREIRSFYRCLAFFFFFSSKTPGGTSEPGETGWFERLLGSRFLILTFHMHVLGGIVIARGGARPGEKGGNKSGSGSRVGEA